MLSKVVVKRHVCQESGDGCFKQWTSSIRGKHRGSRLHFKYANQLSVLLVRCKKKCLLNVRFYWNAEPLEFLRIWCIQRGCTAARICSGQHAAIGSLWCKNAVENKQWDQTRLISSKDDAVLLRHTGILSHFCNWNVLSIPSFAFQNNGSTCMDVLPI